jgi:hypothetical protein
MIDFLVQQCNTSYHQSRAESVASDEEAELGDAT